MRSKNRFIKKTGSQRTQKIQAVLGCMLGAAASLPAQQILMSPPPVNTTPSAVAGEPGDHSGSLLDSVGSKLTSPLSLLHWGPISGRPHLNYSFSYAEGLESTPGNKDSSIINTFTPGITFNGGTHWTLDYSPSLVYYSSKNLKDSLNHNVILSAGFNYEDWVLGFSQGYSLSSNPNAETAAQTAIEGYTTTLSASYRINSKFSIDANVSQMFSFAEQLSSYKSWSTTEYLNYQFAPALTTGVGMTFGYDNESVGPDMSHEQLLARVQWRAAQKVSLDIHTGLEDRQYLSSGTSDTITPVLGAAINYNPVSQTQLTLSADRSISPSLAGNSATTTTTLTLSLQQRLFGKFSSNASLSYTRREYDATVVNGSAQRADDSYVFSTGVGYSLNRHASLSGSYQYSRNSSSSGLFSYSTSQLGFNAGYVF
jgi:hypothetical protein